MNINIGCGITPTIGFKNYDNSLSLLLSSYKFLGFLFYKLRIINKEQLNFITFVKSHNIKYLDVRKSLPFKNDSINILYSSHMLEHLDRSEANFFLENVMRVLRPGGVLRLVLPDLKKLIDKYIVNKDADNFIISSLMCVDNPRGFLKKFLKLLIGNRHHLWMYDSQSIIKLLENHRFQDIKILKKNETSIKDYGLLDLSEGGDESLFIEAYKK